MDDTTKYICLRCREVHLFRKNEAGRWECTGCGREPERWTTDGKKASYESVYNWLDTYPNRRKE